MVSEVDNPSRSSAERFVYGITSDKEGYRPNTISIFCAAVCRNNRLRTYIGITFKLLFPCKKFHKM